MSFPTSPVNGQLAVVNNITYQFDAVKSAWIRVLSAADFLTVNNLSVIKTLSGNISGGNVYATGYYFANGQPFTTSNYGNTNVAAYLAGNVTTGNISSTGYFWANGQPFLSSGYSDANVAAYLTTATINTTGNISGGGVRNTAGPTPPANPVPGDTWYDTDHDVMLRYVDDGDSLQWVDITGIMVGTNGGGYKFTAGATPPANPTAGDNWYDTSTDILFRYITDGTTWCWVDNSSIGIEYQTYGNTQVAAYLLANPQGSTYSNTNVAAYLTGNVTTGNVSATAYYFANGAPFTSSNYGDTQVAAYLLGNVTTGNVSATAYYFANGAPFTSSNYGNTQVAAYLPTNSTILTLQANAATQSLDIASLQSNVTAANAAIITANTGMKSYVDAQTYSNVNAAGYLAGNITVGNISSAGKIAITGNVSAGNLLISQIYWAANNSPYTPAGFVLNSRTTANASTASIANNTNANVNITGYKGYNLYKIYSSNAAWVRVYTSQAALTSDASRTQGTDPTPDIGIIAEVITSTPTTTIQLSPAVLGYNNEIVPNVTIPVSVTNLSGGANAITVSLTMVQTEV